MTAAAAHYQTPPTGIFAGRRLADGSVYPAAYLTHTRYVNGGVPANGETGDYLLCFTQAAKKHNFPLVPMRTLEGANMRLRDGWNGVYRDETVPPPFSRRLMSKSRPDRGRFLEWLDLDEQTADEYPFTVLARTMGRKATDEFETFAKPLPDGKGRYDFLFPWGYRMRFGNGYDDQMKRDTYIGVAHKLQEYKNSGIALRPEWDDGGGRIFLYPDYTGLKARVRVAPVRGFGQIPPIYTDDVLRLLGADRGAANNVRITVHQVNLDASLDLMVIFRFQCNRPDDFEFCSGESFRLLAPALAQSWNNRA